MEDREIRERELSVFPVFMFICPAYPRLRKPECSTLFPYGTTVDGRIRAVHFIQAVKKVEPDTKIHRPEFLSGNGPSAVCGSIVSTVKRLCRQKPD